MSSTEISENAASQPAENLDDSNAVSSPAENTEAEKSTFDLVKEVVDGQVESPTAKDGVEPSQDEAPPEEGPERDPGELSEDDKKQLSAKTQNRIHQLVEQRKAVEARIAEVAPKAESFDKIVEYSKKHGLTANDIDNAFDIMASLRTNPQEGFRKLEAVYVEYARQVGVILPEDLTDQVQKGYISEQHARELAKTRSEREFYAQRMKEREDTEREQGAQRETQQTVQKAVQAADSWVSLKAKNDPDWNRKQQRVSDLVKLKLLETRQYPRTEQEVFAICEDALKRVDEELKPYLQTQKREIRPVTAMSSARTVAEPKDTVDVIKNVLAGMN